MSCADLLAQLEELRVTARVIGIVTFVLGSVAGAAVIGMWYERRWARALELERQREALIRYRQIEE